MKKIWFAFVALSAYLCAGHPFDDPNAFRQYAYKTQDTHYILGIAEDGRALELEDRSTWRIPFSATDRVLSEWKKGDPVFILPNSCPLFCTDYPYTIQNTKRKSAFSSLIETCPDNNGPYTKFVHAMDEGNATVTLINHYGAKFTFHLNPSDWKKLSDWEDGDIVFVATNKTCCNRYPDQSFLLINTMSLSQVGARE